MEAPGRRETPARWLSAQQERVMKARVSTGQCLLTSGLFCPKGKYSLRSFRLPRDLTMPNSQATKFSTSSYLTGINSA